MLKNTVNEQDPLYGTEVLILPAFEYCGSNIATCSLKKQTIFFLQQAVYCFPQCTATAEEFGIGL